MSKYYLYQDEKKCISCRSCEVQCKVNKGLDPGPRPNQIVVVGPVQAGSRPRATSIFMPCFHCEEPWCVPACPTGAVQKRPKDGIVFIDQELCVGCKSCIMACPWGAPQWDARKGKAVKCDYCMDRIDAGLKPACVTACPTGCLLFGPAERMPDVKRVRHVHQITAVG
ncbi:4Fe-4S dicluster domain-containing protein [Desulfofundulus thermocisternus]|uniref:4Fe-4S dicluster domain-containing protein n=1 Tax=Desulfofundulus thermocisternus TaxID=42471 RepID=UPI0019DC2F93|nr:4Fe-4S dicluster domain-containing protein [Desulfofundulus thermocisternus]MBE3586152.1 4Fe-4S dicluster domain-containing protein [Thermoanaerobacter sp.]MCS5694906.1 4Fe-4S dicluster domain-containing protein [Desulfofundulus thermocisternus]